eukprot:TRINITY_DN7100_c0_g1_i1.p1 TRINITY_DN7100_c0_g1~~TRINITY_DN7100_c0_g1_i1.p1  ORF type:complete len:1017 (+),score=132.43 TRINITY_DN7100_c0_g1_i1:283-3051(+)
MVASECPEIPLGTTDAPTQSILVPASPSRTLPWSPRSPALSPMLTHRRGTATPGGTAPASPRSPRLLSGSQRRGNAATSQVVATCLLPPFAATSVACADGSCSPTANRRTARGAAGCASRPRVSLRGGFEQDGNASPNGAVSRQVSSTYRSSCFATSDCDSTDVQNARGADVSPRSPRSPVSRRRSSGCESGSVGSRKDSRVVPPPLSSTGMARAMTWNSSSSAAASAAVAAVSRRRASDRSSQRDASMSPTPMPTSEHQDPAAGADNVTEIFEDRGRRHFRPRDEANPLDLPSKFRPSRRMPSVADTIPLKSARSHPALGSDSSAQEVLPAGVPNLRALATPSLGSNLALALRPVCGGASPPASLSSFGQPVVSIHGGSGGAVESSLGVSARSSRDYGDGRSVAAKLPSLPSDGDSGRGGFLFARESQTKPGCTEAASSLSPRATPRSSLSFHPGRRRLSSSQSRPGGVATPQSPRKQCSQVSLGLASARAVPHRCSSAFASISFGPASYATFGAEVNVPVPRNERHHQDAEATPSHQRSSAALRYSLNQHEDSHAGVSAAGDSGGVDSSCCASSQRAEAGSVQQANRPLPVLASRAISSAAARAVRRAAPAAYRVGGVPCVRAAGASSASLGAAAAVPFAAAGTTADASGPPIVISARGISSDWSGHRGKSEVRYSCRSRNTESSGSLADGLAPPVSLQETPEQNSVRTRGRSCSSIASITNWVSEDGRPQGEGCEISASTDLESHAMHAMLCRQAAPFGGHTRSGFSAAQFRSRSAYSLGRGSLANEAEEAMRETNPLKAIPRADAMTPLEIRYMGRAIKSVNRRLSGDLKHKARELVSQSARESISTGLSEQQNARDSISTGVSEQQNVSNVKDNFSNLITPAAALKAVITPEKIHQKREDLNPSGSAASTAAPSSPK